MTRLITNRACRYASRDLTADEEFEAEDKDVLVLTAGNPSLARAASTAAEAESDLLDQDKKTKRYSRRDLRAKE